MGAVGKFMSLRLECGASRESISGHPCFVGVHCQQKGKKR